jgi:hypothetical protein
LHSAFDRKVGENHRVLAECKQKKERMMKMRLIPNGVALALMLLPGANSELCTCFAQGGLTPPGAPAPTMKTLQQIEPRTPISSVPVSILNSGSYYLTDNLDLSYGDAIFVSANNVTIDLNGFTIRSFDSTNGSVGIRIDTSPFVEFHDITILNGHLAGYSLFYSGGVYSGNGFGYGIYSSGNPHNVRVSNVTVSGCLYDGVNVGLAGTAVESCAVSTVGGIGIYAKTVSRCTAYQCGQYGIYAYAASECYGDTTSSLHEGLYAYAANNCSGSSVGNGFISFTGLNAHVANNCYGYNSGPGGGGLSADVANNCYGVSPGNGAGIDAYTAQNCYGESPGGDGISAYTAQNCYGHSGGSGHGVYATATAQNCVGLSGTGNGLYAGRVATTCDGTSASGSAAALRVDGTANCCSGLNSGGGPAIQTCIAIGCTTFGGAINTSCSKWLGTP